MLHLRIKELRNSKTQSILQIQYFSSQFCFIDVIFPSENEGLPIPWKTKQYQRLRITSETYSTKVSIKKID